MMTLGRLAAGLVLAAALGPVMAAGEGVQDFVDIFRAGCVDHLPDFTGSRASLEKLGFVHVDGQFRRETPERAMLAEIYERTADGGHGCVLASTISQSAALEAAVAAMVAEISNNRFRRGDAERNGKRVDAFMWHANSREVLVVVLPQVSGMRALTILVEGAK